jgi:hypothetical protein
LRSAYLQEREGARLWFQADADDGDPAAFFAALSEAFRLATHGVLPGLLVFGPEYNQNLLTFARRYFEGLFASLPAGSVLVLDNYQEIPVEALVHDMFARGFVSPTSGSEGAGPEPPASTGLFRPAPGQRAIGTPNLGTTSE